MKKIQEEEEYFQTGRFTVVLNRSQQSKLDEQFENELKQKYPNELFKLNIFMLDNTRNRIWVKVTCNESLANKLTYTKEMFGSL